MHGPVQTETTVEEETDGSNQLSSIKVNLYQTLSKSRDCRDFSVAPVLMS